MDFLISDLILDTLLGPVGRANAYLDPGSGSVLLQLLLAALLGGGFLIKAYWRKIINFFRKLTGKEVIVDDIEDEDA